jgi:hypothetical protein
LFVLAVNDILRAASTQLACLSNLKYCVYKLYQNLHLVMSDFLGILWLCMWHLGTVKKFGVEGKLSVNTFNAEF